VCNNKYFDSLKCVGLVYTNTVEAVSKKKDTESSLTNETRTPPLISPKVRCENCGEMAAHVTHLIRDGPVEIDLSVCDDCLWLRRASWNLKLNKLWKPTPKDRLLEEAKP